MRILLHHRVASQDGQAVHIEELHAALTRLGYDTRLVGPASFANANFGSSNWLVDKIKSLLPGAAYELLEIAYNVKAYVRLRAAIREYKPDVIYERFSLFLFAGIILKRQTGLPMLLEVNSPLFEERAKNDGLRLKKLGRWAQRLLWNRVDHALPVTGVLARTMTEYGVPQARISVIPNGINQARFGHVPDTENAKKALGIPPRITLGFTGFIRGWNAVHRLIDFVAAQKNHLDLHILVVGDGPAREPLQDYAREKGVSDRLTIFGVVGRDDVARYVAAFDIAVLPGVTPYSSPLKLFEYLQLGRAIVGPDAENIREILTDGQNAVLFDDSKQGFESALLALSSDKALRDRLGAAARRTVAEKSLTWDENARRVVAVAESLIAKQSKL